MRTRTRMCLFEVSLILLPIWGGKFPQIFTFGAWIGVFRPNAPNIETLLKLLHQLLHRSQPNFVQWSRPPSTISGWSKYAPSKSKMADLSLRNFLWLHMATHATRSFLVNSYWSRWRRPQLQSWLPVNYITEWQPVNSVHMIKVLWRCWFGGRNGIRPVKNWVVECWRGYVSGSRCRFAYGPVDATATHFLLLQ